jgi:formylglycine-generating enzyme required for sulfatase activity
MRKQLLIVSRTTWANKQEEVQRVVPGPGSNRRPEGGRRDVQRSAVDADHDSHLRPSARGLFDVHGNLEEWCHGWELKDEDVDELVDPIGADTGSVRVSRGGGWGGVATYCRSARRGSYLPLRQGVNLGFRVAVVPFCQASEPENQVSSDAGSGASQAETRLRQ